MIKVNDLRIQSLVERTLDKHFAATYTTLDLNKYSECLVKETVQECMKQLAIAVNINDYDTSIIIHKMWDHLAKRYAIADENIS